MITTYSDGGARGNPGPAAIGVVAYEDGKIIERDNEFLGVATNNQAEYRAITRALEIAAEHGKEVKCYLDSQLVVRQLNGEYAIRDEELIELHAKLKKVESRLEKVEYIHVRREDRGMQEADRLVNEALDKEESPKT